MRCILVLLVLLVHIGAVRALESRVAHTFGVLGGKRILALECSQSTDIAFPSVPSNLLLQAHQRALKRLELKKDRRRKKKRKAARHEEAAVQQQRAAEAELETERETAEAQQQSLSPFSWNLFGSTEVQVSATGRSPCHHHPGCCWPMYLRLGNASLVCIF